LWHFAPNAHRCEPGDHKPEFDLPGQVLRTKAGVVIPPTGGQTYIVQRGDTLRIIANRFGTTVDAILRLNPQITNANLIFVGQSIRLPEGVIIPPTGDQTYMVQRGDTLRIIANRFGTTVTAILQLNPQITNPNLIFPGQVIRIRAGAPPTDGFQSYIVQRGDTLADYCHPLRHDGSSFAQPQSSDHQSQPDLPWSGRACPLA
jgi:LysM repeat protein